MEDPAYRLESDKPFDSVVESIEKETAGHNFRVLHVHDVQATLAEKGFERGPLKIIEVCNAGFAHRALDKENNVALFMPCKFVVGTEGIRTVVTLARPVMIAEMLPDAGLDELAAEVESTLRKVMEASV
ncbi:MAG: DUF302 domain-containing protein [Candidatus Zixiibacteriota bacterium]|nr:MAG: DUF302 domain-containing protein [candidate division Zixibacteria bacterium]